MPNVSINNYTLLYKLGDGGMAEVWYAENNIGKKAAVKILKKELSLMTDVAARFENEARVMVQLNHPNIRQVYDFATIDNRPCIIMEYLDGADLSQRLKKGERFTKKQITEWWNQMVEALNYTHAKNVVHRDIKPSNIFIGNNGQLKLLDFGIAKIKDSITITQTGTRMGTLMYMSPEQIKDSKHLDYRTDIYSLAVTFFHLLTGTAPYDNTSSSEFEIQTRIVTEALNLDLLPPEWSKFLWNYLKKEPDKRETLIFFNVSQPSTSKTITSNPDKTEVVTIKKTGANKSVPVETKKRPKVFIIVGAIFVPIILFLLISLNINSTKTNINDYPSEGTFTDSRDGHQYKWVKIGNQIWMAENLAYLPQIDSLHKKSNTQPCYYVADYYLSDYSDDNISDAKSTFNYKKYGVLYNWPAAKASCPTGWHLPKNSEWMELIKFIKKDQKNIREDYLDFYYVANNLKSKTGWYLNKNGSDNYGFNGLPGGYWSPDFVDAGLGVVGAWWSKTKTSSNKQSSWPMSSTTDYISKYEYDKYLGLSVRCIKD